MNISSSILAKLNHEQLIIVEKWEAEREERSRLIDLIAEAEKEGNEEVVDKLLHTIIDNTPDFCEHNRHIASPCCACNDIEKILYPELYDENGELIEE